MHRAGFALINDTIMILLNYFRIPDLLFLRSEPARVNMLKTLYIRLLYITQTAEENWIGDRHLEIGIKGKR